MLREYGGGVRGVAEREFPTAESHFSLAARPFRACFVLGYTLERERDGDRVRDAPREREEYLSETSRGLRRRDAHARLLRDHASGAACSQSLGVIHHL